MKRAACWAPIVLCTAAALAVSQSTPRRAAAADSAALPQGNSAAVDLDRLVSDLERRERDTRTRFDELGRGADAARARVLARGRAYVRLARSGLLPVGEGFAALVDHTTKLERWRYALERDVNEQKRATLERGRLAQMLQDLQQRLLPLRAEQQALARAHSQLLAAEDRQRAFERAFQSTTGGAHTAVYGAAGPSDPAEFAAGFAAMKGRLPFPLTGRSEIERARRSGSDGPALEMRAPFGTPVRAVFPGRVAFADNYADYGKTVIVDHGERHYTVSGNLGSVDVRVGDEVTTNTRLGTVGDSGHGALVYFELRVGTRTVDASSWFGL